MEFISCYLYSTFAIFLAVTMMFFWAVKIKRYAIIDSFWGMGFVIVSWTTILFLTSTFSHIHLRSLIVATLVTLWAIRLSTHITLRGVKRGEDERYLNLMMNWKRWPLFQRYLKIFILQGFLILVVSYPLIRLFTTSTEKQPDFGILDLLAILVFFKGFLFETIADYQLAVFCKNKKEKTFIQTGLWRYSRHPNYFGEIMLWWGLTFLTFLGTFDIFVFVAPIIMQLLITYVSGVPMLEKKFISYPGYKEYQLKTNKLLYWPIRLF